MVNNVDNIILSNYNKIKSGKTTQRTGSTSASSALSDFSAVLQTALNSKTNLETSVDLEDIFQRAADQYGVPVNLLKAVGKAESNFNPEAVSCCGAQGIMQLMPATASSLGVQNSFDPEQNIMGGAKLLGQLLTHYNGDTKLALAAYNAGCGNVDKYGGVPPFAETQNYVVKVMDYAGESFSAPTAQVNPFNTLSSSNKLGSSSSAGANSTSGTSYTYNDYLAFLQLMLAQVQTKLFDHSENDSTNSLSSSLNDYLTNSVSSSVGTSSDNSSNSYLSSLSDILGNDSSNRSSVSNSVSNHYTNSSNSFTNFLNL